MAASWLESATEILRILINDLADTPTYTDDTLEQTLLVSAGYVVQEIILATDYTVNFLASTVTPDPIDDSIFINFTVLKAACLVNSWKFDQIAVIQGIKAKMGPAELSVNSSSSLLLALIEKGSCKLYEELKQQNNFGNDDLVKAIMSPFVSNLFQPSNDYLGRY